MSHDLDKLRSAAKLLKKNIRNGSTDALARLKKVLPGCKAPKHADFLHVIALENGYESWPKLKFACEAMQMSRDQKAERLLVAINRQQEWVINKLLSDDPMLASHNLAIQIALYNLEAVKKAMASPDAATKPIADATPLLHLAFSRYIHIAPEKSNDMLAIADLLLQHGADPDDGLQSSGETDHKLSALYGALCHADNIKLGEWFLQNGASPDDNESLYHATELDHTNSLELLIKHNVSTRNTNALLRALDFNTVKPVRILLEYGADPNECASEHTSGEPVPSIPALHHAARRWCSGELAELLVKFKADPKTLWEGYTPYAVAKMFGNQDFANKLEELGHHTPLSETEQILAQCAEGVAPDTEIDIFNINDECRLLINRLASRPGKLNHIRALVEVGLDPDTPDEMKLPPLQIAAWEGVAEYVEYFLGFSPDLSHVNSFGGNAIETVIHGSEACPSAAERNHIACARLLLQAGSTISRQQIEYVGNEAMADFLGDWLASNQ